MIPFAHTRARPAELREEPRPRRALRRRPCSTLYGTLHPAREGFDLAQGQGGGAIDWFRIRGRESFAVELRDGRELAGFELPADQLIPSAEENWTAFLELALALAVENAPARRAASPTRSSPATQPEPRCPPGIAATGCRLPGGSAPAAARRCSVRRPTGRPAARRSSLRSSGVSAAVGRSPQVASHGGLRPGTSFKSGPAPTTDI